MLRLTLFGRPLYLDKMSVGTHINDMPAELLIAIFKFVLATEGRPANFRLIWREGSIVDTAQLLKLTHVCKRWRNVATAYPLLWSHSDDRHLEQLETFAQRARTAPLSLFLTHNLTKMVDVLHLHGHRLARLDIGVSSLEEVALVPLHTPLDSLECFTLSYLNPPSRNCRTLAPIMLFGRPDSSLRALAIGCVSTWLPINRFPHLTHLYLCMNVIQGLPDVPTFLRLLSNTPILAFLHVSFLLDPLSTLQPGLSSTVPLVHLPFMQSLEFHRSNVHAVFAALERLVLPDSVFVRLQDMEAQAPPPPLPQLAAVQGITQLTVATSCDLLQLVADGAISGLWLSCRLYSAEETDEQDGAWSPWLALLNDMLPLSNVTSLHVSVDRHAEIISALLPHLSSLGELCIRYDHGCDGYVAGVSFPDAEVLYGMLTQRTPLLCPSLTSIVIDIDADRRFKSIPYLYPPEIKRALAVRAEAGHPIHRVVIQPFADPKPRTIPLLSHVAQQLATTFSPPLVTVRSPGPPTAPFEEHARWHVAGADHYWEFREFQRPCYILPWDQ